jgi:hypothetical protein
MKLGIFLPSLGYNQNAIQAISAINTLIGIDNTVYPTFFYKRIDAFRLKAKTIATTFDRIYQYDGHLITTNLDTTYIALQCNRLKSINFYVSELEWTRRIGNYISNSSIYKNKNVNLICPSSEYALDNYCGVKVQDIITGFNIYEIVARIRARNP